MSAANTERILRYIRQLAGEREPPSSDAELLRRYLATRDESAFAALVRRHGPMVFAVCRSVLRQRDDAEDAFQAVFLILARKAGSIRRPESLSSFLHGVAYRVALKARAENKRRQDREAKASLPATAATAEDDLSWGEVRSILHAELAALPDRWRAPLVLCYLEGLTQEEAGQRLGWTATAVKGRLQRGREKLRRRLERRGVALTAALAAALTGQTLAETAVRTVPSFTIATATSTAAALASDFLRSWIPMKLAMLSAVLLSGGLVAGGMAMRSPKPQGEETPTPSAEKQADRGPTQRPAVDAHGDPLPPGAVARLGTVQRRFDAEELAWTSDGRTILACNSHRSFRWWDARTGKLKKSQDWPGPAWRRVHLSPNGKTLAAEEMSGQLTLWDVATGRRLHSYDGYGWYGDYPFVFSPDSRVLIVVNRKDMAGIPHHIDIDTGERRILGKNKAVKCLAVSPDNKRLFFGGADGSVRCWDIATAREVWKVKRCPYAMALSPDGRTLVVDAGNNSPQRAIRSLDAATGRIRGEDRPIKEFSNPFDLRFHPQGDALLVSVCNQQDSAVNTALWDLATDKERFRMPAYRVRCSPDGKMLAGFSGRELQCWDLATGKPLYPDTARLGHTHAASALTYSPDGKLLASVGYDCTIRLWDVVNSRLLHTFRDRARYYPAFVRFTSDGKLIAGLDGATLRIWDIATGKEVRRLMLRDAGSIGSLGKVHLSLDGKTLSTLHSPQLAPTPLGEKRAGALIRWDMATGKPLSPPMRLPPNRPLDFSADGRVFLIDEKDIHEVPEPDVRLAYPAGHYLALGVPKLGLTFSPDGALVAAPLRIDVTEGDQFKQVARGIQVWELATGQAVVRLPAKDFAHLAFSPDGRALAAAGPNDLRVWEIATAKELYRQAVPGHLLNVHGSPLVFAPDGRTLAVALQDTTITVWDVSVIHRGVPARPALSAKQQDALWIDLVGKDAAKAYAAIGELTARPEQAVSLLRQRLQPVAPLPSETLQRLIADLDSTDFPTREAASRRLTDMRPLADSALRAALAKKPSLEMRKRIETVLSARVAVALTPETLRGLRAVRVLEHADTPEARRLLRELATGAEGARLTREADAALKRLNRHSP